MEFYERYEKIKERIHWLRQWVVIEGDTVPIVFALCEELSKLDTVLTNRIQRLQRFVNELQARLDALADRGKPTAIGQKAEVTNLEDGIERLQKHLVASNHHAAGPPGVKTRKKITDLEDAANRLADIIPQMPDPVTFPDPKAYKAVAAELWYRCPHCRLIYASKTNAEHCPCQKEGKR